MNNSDFEGPPWGWSMVSIVGGLASAIGLIVGLEFSAVRIKAYIHQPLKGSSQVSSTQIELPQPTFIQSAYTSSPISADISAK